MSESSSPAALHQMRISKVPLRPADTTIASSSHGTLTAQPIEFSQDPVEKQSSLDRVRYNIVGGSGFLNASVICLLIQVASQQCRKFIIRLAHALMEFGAPMHKIEEQLAGACDFLSIKAHFVLFNTVIILVFDDPDGASAPRNHFIQRPPGLSLAQLQKTHAVYSAVIHDKISATEGTRQLKEIMDHPNGHGFWVKVLIAFLAGFSICPMGFSGSFVDSLVAGVSSACLIAIQLLRGGDVLFTGIFEIVVAILVSLVARLLNSIGGHVFCYSAISSSGVVLILPGFLVLQGSLELTSKNFITGATKIVYAVIYSLILGFSLTLGSDIAFLMQPGFRAQRDRMAADIGSTVALFGIYAGTNITAPLPALNRTFVLTQSILPDEPLVKYHYVMEGCYRDPAWSIIFQPLSWMWLFALAPLFVFSLASLNGQGCKDWRRMLVIVIFGCCSFTVNKIFNMWIFDRGDIVSGFGATVVGILGTIYGHYSEGDALPSMIPGILVLLPAGLSVVGGLSANYQNQASSVMSWLSTGLRMVQVTIGIAAGLFASNLAVTMFISLGARLRGRPPRKSQVGSAF